MERLVKRLGIVLFLMFALFVVCVAGTVLYLPTLDDDGWRRILTYWVERETGNRLTIAGDFSFTLSWHPALSVEDVRLDNVEPSNQTPILSLGRFEITMSLLDLFQRVVHIERLRIRDGTFNIRPPRGEQKSEISAAAEHHPFPLLLGDAELDQVRVIVHPMGDNEAQYSCWTNSP